MKFFIEEKIFVTRNLIFSAISGGIAGIISSLIILRDIDIGPARLLIGIFFGCLVFQIFVIPGWIVGYNVIVKCLNRILESERILNMILERREPALNEQLEYSQRSALHEMNTHMEVAQMRSSGNEIKINRMSPQIRAIIEAVPEITATQTFATAQNTVMAFENRYLSMWNDYAQAIREYQDEKNTFPLLIIVWMTNAVTLGRRFPNFR